MKALRVYSTLLLKCYVGLFLVAVAYHSFQFSRYHGHSEDVPGLRRYDDSALDVPRSENAPEEEFPLLVEKFYMPGQERAVCRIHNACVRFRRNSVKLRFPEWLQRLSPRMQDCSLPPLIEPDGPRPHQFLSSSKDLVVGMTVSPRDYHFPHFLVRSGALVDVVGVLFGQSRLRYEPLCGGPCNTTALRETPVKRFRENVSPAIVSFPDVREGTGLSKWTRQFLDYLFQAHHNGVAVYPYNLRADPDLVVETCFRSIILPSTELNEPAENGLQNHPLFLDNGLQKTPRESICEVSGRVAVTILDRDDSRYFGDLSELQGAIERAIQYKNRKVSIRRVTFDDATFAEQVEVMQSSDIVIAAHGAAVTNALFLRKGSLLVEVFPFGYYYKGFQNAGNAWFEIDAQWQVSWPDRSSFQDVINSDLDDMPGDETVKLRVAEVYNSLVGKYNSALPTTLDEYWDEDVEYLNNQRLGRHIIKHQNLFPDLSDLSLRIKAWHTSFCDEIRL